MSVRAYRLIKREVAEQSSFNLWNDDDLIDFLEKIDETSFNDYLSENGGSICISVGALEKALTDFKWEKGDYRPEAIKADIDFAKKQKEEWVNYECY